MDRELLYKYFSGHITPAEEQQVVAWLQQDEANVSAMLQERQLWDMVLLNGDEELRITGGTRKGIVRRIGWKAIGRVAAILIIGAGLGWLLAGLRSSSAHKALVNTVEVPAGQRVKLQLSDGTLVFLNARSKFTYPSDFAGNMREVKLDGEGYFEVTHNEKWPFQVVMPTHTIKVLGTTFNVREYSSDRSFEATLVQGSVKVIENAHQDEVALLKPGEKISSKETITAARKTPLEVYTKVKANVEDNISWRTGLYTFNNEPFSDVIRKLELYYAVNFIIKDSSILNYRSTGKFRQQETIDQILDVIKTDHPFKYSYDKDLNEVIVLPPH